MGFLYCTSVVWPQSLALSNAAETSRTAANCTWRIRNHEREKERGEKMCCIKWCSKPIQAHLKFITNIFILRALHLRLFVKIAQCTTWFSVCLHIFTRQWRQNTECKQNITSYIDDADGVHVPQRYSKINRRSQTMRCIRWDACPMGLLLNW